MPLLMHRSKFTETFIPLTLRSSGVDAPVVLAWLSVLWRYPVKSMLGERVDALEIRENEVVGDREWALVDDQGRALAAKTVPQLLFAKAAVRDGTLCITLPDGREVAAGAPQADGALSEWLERPVRLMQADPDVQCRYEVHIDAKDNDSPVVVADGPQGSFRDSRHPVHLLTTASLRAAAENYPDGEWDARRFRPNLLIDTDGGGFVEDDWVGSHVAVGEVVFEIRKRCGRCTIPNRPQPGLAADVGIARSLARHHGLDLGVYAGIVQPGSVRVGDEVRLA